MGQSGVCQIKPFSFYETASAGLTVWTVSYTLTCSPCRFVTVSPDGAKIPPGQIIYPADVIWTTGSPDADATPGQVAIYRNGGKVKGSVNYLTRKGLDIFACDPAPPSGTGAGLDRWNGSGWTLIGPTCQ